MGLNVFQRGVVQGTLALSALISCSSPQTGNVAKDKASLMTSGAETSQTNAQKKTIRKRIIVGLNTLFANYDSMNKKEGEIIQTSTEKHPTLLDSNRKDIDSCQLMMQEEENIRAREAMAKILGLLRDKMYKCLSLPRPERMECTANQIVENGHGDVYAENIGILNETCSRTLACLNRIPH